MTNRLLELQNEIAPRAYENGDDEDARLYGRATAVRALAATRAVRYQVDGSVPVVRAPSPGTAWAAGLAMLLGHRDRATLSPDEAARRAGAHFLDLLHRGAGIPVADKASLLTGGSLTAIPAMRYGPEDVERLLRERGPLWICQDDQSAALFSPRLRIVTGIDGTAAGGRGTLVDVIDPETGRQGRERLDALPALGDDERPRLPVRGRACETAGVEDPQRDVVWQRVGTVPPLVAAARDREVRVHPSSVSPR